MTRPRREIITRIRACMKLSILETNPNEHERTAAKRAAKMLIKKYGVTAKELGVISSELTSEWLDGARLDTVVEGLLKGGVKPKRGWDR